MKELFTGFLSVSLSGSLVIALILLLRAVFRKAPKSLICAMWILAILRLMLPFQIEANWSLRPDTPVISPGDTQFLTEAAPELRVDVPGFVPQVQTQNTRLVYVDYIAIAGVVWIIGVSVMGFYTLISYLRLKLRVREAILLEKGVYVSGKLDTAFLLGYFVPKIYLPATIEPTEAELVIAHERTHIRRGDNWIKLIGFLCLALHWFNPLVWLAYILLCRDIEDACDEAVVKNLDIDSRKAYSKALISCNGKGNPVAACPVAFGEISIGQRIRNVLSYRKPTLWICIALVLSMVAVSVFFLVDPVKNDPPYYEELMDQLGQPMETVCQALELEEASLKELGGGIYETPITVEYENVTFRLLLGFGYRNGLLGSFSYSATYTDTEQAAQDAAHMANSLYKMLGKGYQWEENENPKRLRDVTKESLMEQYEQEGKMSLGDQWDRTSDASKKAKTYLNQIEVSSQWKQIYGEKARLYKVSPHFYMTYRLGCSELTGEIFLMIEYLTGWQPGHYSMVVTSDYD